MTESETMEADTEVSSTKALGERLVSQRHSSARDAPMGRIRDRSAEIRSARPDHRFLANRFIAGIARFISKILQASEHITPYGLSVIFFLEK